MAQAVCFRLLHLPHMEQQPRGRCFYFHINNYIHQLNKTISL